MTQPNSTRNLEDWQASECYRTMETMAQNAASWVDLPDDQNGLRSLFESITTDVDPMVVDAYGPPDPFSGEWGGESLPELFDGWENVPTDDELVELENVYQATYWDTLADHIRYHLD